MLDKNLLTTGHWISYLEERNWEEDKKNKYESCGYENDNLSWPGCVSTKELRGKMIIATVLVVLGWRMRAATVYSYAGNDGHIAARGNDEPVDYYECQVTFWPIVHGVSRRYGGK